MSGKKPIDKLREMMRGVHCEEDIMETIFKVLENHEKRLQSIEERILKDTKP